MTPGVLGAAGTGRFGSSPRLQASWTPRWGRQRWDAESWTRPGRTLRLRAGPWAQLLWAPRGRKWLRWLRGCPTFVGCFDFLFGLVSLYADVRRQPGGDDTAFAGLTGRDHGTPDARQCATRRLRPRRDGAVGGSNGLARVCVGVLFGCLCLGVWFDGGLSCQEPGVAVFSVHPPSQTGVSAVVPRAAVVLLGIFGEGGTCGFGVAAAVAAALTPVCLVSCWLFRSVDLGCVFVCGSSHTVW